MPINSTLAAACSKALGFTVNPNIPTAALNLNFTTGTLDSRVTFTRSTTGSYYNSAGVLSTAAINAPRFDYNPSTLQANGLLIEESRTNLLLQSQFASVWSFSASATFSTYETAPDNTNTARVLNDSSSTAVGYVYQGVSFTSGTAYAISVYVKPKSSNTFALTSFTQAGQARFDLSTGTVVSATGIASNATITNVGNGWYRCACLFTASATASNNIGYGDYIATSTGDIFTLWGAQLEAGSFATSYIPTVASQVTRAADVAVMTGTNFSSWYNQTEGTVYADVISCAANNIPQVTAQFSDGSSLNRIVTRRNASGYIATAVVDNNVTQGDISVTSNIAGNAEYKTATGIKAASSAIAVNGSLGGSITTGTIPLVLNKLEIGQNLGTQYMNGCIKRLTYYNKRLTNQQLQYLTR